MSGYGSEKDHFTIEILKADQRVQFLSLFGLN